MSPVVHNLRGPTASPLKWLGSKLPSPPAPASKGPTAESGSGNSELGRPGRLGRLRSSTAGPGRAGGAPGPTRRRHGESASSPQLTPHPTRKGTFAVPTPAWRLGARTEEPSRSRPGLRAAENAVLRVRAEAERAGAGEVKPRSVPSPGGG